jgi:hypothetical protein
MYHPPFPAKHERVVVGEGISGYAGDRGKKRDKLRSDDQCALFSARRHAKNR